MNKGLNIVFWNIRSLINKIDSVRLEIENIKPDMFNINESWLHEDIGNDFVSIKGYTILCSDRRENDVGITKRGGGLCTYMSGMTLHVQSKKTSPYLIVILNYMLLSIICPVQEIFI